MVFERTPLFELFYRKAGLFISLEPYLARVVPSHATFEETTKHKITLLIGTLI